MIASILSTLEVNHSRTRALRYFVEDKVAISFSVTDTSEQPRTGATPQS
jgi:hypothetical protein